MAYEDGNDCIALVSVWLEFISIQDYVFNIY